MQLNSLSRYRSLTVLFAASLVAAAALPVAQAAESKVRLDLASSSYTETADGALVLNAEPVRLAHAPTIVASNCIRLESGKLTRQRDRARFVNDCAEPVTLSYCIAADDVGAMRCDQIGRRGFESIEIAARGRATIAASLPVDADVRWVACQSADNHHSTLIDNGTRGECLVSAGPTAVAASDRR